ncbi:hypothetical protein BJ508DRAFT_332355 [Ascobolus immersus RN42]|uniref:Uncharacterized protein n=1 Tax=Ascobolus immersus RN42 TaxID=1160509 RepID=A0A3N4HQ89_ASCIM|nr:hypothetical protein BJ508DRAFT_332355 [Ascobolus immersus RN42]
MFEQVNECERMLGDMSIDDDSFIGGSDTSMDDISFNQSIVGDSTFNDSFNESVNSSVIGSFDNSSAAESLAQDFESKLSISEGSDGDLAHGPSSPELDAEGYTIDGLEPDFAHFLEHGVNQPSDNLFSSNVNPDAHELRAAQILGSKATLFKNMHKTLDNEMKCLDMLSHLSIADQISITSVYDPELCRQLLGQSECNNMFKHRGLSFFDHVDVVDGSVAIVPSEGMRLRFSVAIGSNGDQVLVAEYWKVSWDDCEDDQVFKVGYIQRFDFDGYDFLMLHIRQHFIVGEITEVWPVKDGRITFGVQWEASPGCRV